MYRRWDNDYWLNQFKPVLAWKAKETGWAVEFPPMLLHSPHLDVRPKMFTSSFFPYWALLQYCGSDDVAMCKEVLGKYPRMLELNNTLRVSLATNRRILTFLQPRWILRATLAEGSWNVAKLLVQSNRKLFNEVSTTKL